MLGGEATRCGCRDCTARRSSLRGCCGTKCAAHDSSLRAVGVVSASRGRPVMTSLPRRLPAKTPAQVPSAVATATASASAAATAVTATMTVAAGGDSGGGSGGEPSAKPSAIGGTAAQMDGETRARQRARVGIGVPASA
eukprot:CAMPEP_0179855982 /NCGR_PEP_ID=MMETSP0982-20121206/10861_1 /TAXON_ID=483367 /ORGANISM="non described non described, Strain CCMP 2436" /LENGTH=138 /DNA_ID=CAMNT_0021742179 /DNA_START=130 /DNA_END=547 /DNA_ORIENTATION=+